MGSRHTPLVLALAAASIAAIPACASIGGMDGSDGSAEAGDWGSGGGSADSGSAAPFAASSGGGAVVDDVFIPTPGGASESYTPFAHLCGEGCTPGGEPDGCSSPESANGSGTPSGQPLHCQLTRVDGDAIPSCEPVGRFGAGDPCHTGADCAAGHGCAAAEGQAGACRQYCCGNVERCEPGTYCEERLMAESLGEGSSPVPIPVCVPAVDCELLNDSVCPAGQTCTIVREDGTTSCVSPGDGKTDEPCPCAPGFVCSMLTNQCKRLCRTDGGSQECGPAAKCQSGSATYPLGFGVCVSTA